jgi:hypothetical protein
MDAGRGESCIRPYAVCGSRVVDYKEYPYGPAGKSGEDGQCPSYESSSFDFAASAATLRTNGLLTRTLTRTLNRIPC